LTKIPLICIGGQAQQGRGDETASTQALSAAPPQTPSSK